ncbi:STAS domain-containing protein [Nocardia jiangsuensis]|uniref:STAS domain-containing protein n=1 Tax=Nocardia jiangsuensis TaxID=1691563 RepID=A0ABV8DPY5_9NOCA
MAAHPVGPGADRPRRPEPDLVSPGTDAAVCFSEARLRRDITLLTVGGEIDLSTAPVLKERLSSAADGTGTLVVDLTPVTFLAAAGLRVLLDAQCAADRSQLRLVWITGARPVDRAVEIGGAGDRLRRVSSLASILGHRERRMPATG